VALDLEWFAERYLGIYRLVEGIVGELEREQHQSEQRERQASNVVGFPSRSAPPPGRIRLKRPS
jgi:hypothetical protein